MDCILCDQYVYVGANAYNCGMCAACYNEYFWDTVTLAAEAMLRGHSTKCASERICTGKSCTCGLEEKKYESTISYADIHGAFSRAVQLTTS